MSSKKTPIQLYLSLTLLFLVSNTSFSQVLTYCSNNNYSFAHIHNYLYIDADRDGYGSNQRSSSLQCTYRVPSGYSVNNTDCNDSNASITPFTLWYRDADGDSYGNAAVTTTNCTQPSGYVSNYNDCNDGDGSVAFNSLWYRDADGDGYGTSSNTTTSCNQPSGYVTNSNDYNDSTTTITNIAPQTFYRDADGDGYGSPSVTVYYSYQPSGYVTNNSDCNDGDGSVNPNTAWFRDNDGDGYGSGGAPVFSCLQPSGYARNSGDCNDYDSSLNPATVWYRDADGDGYGTSSVTTASCSPPSGYVRNSSDYNDGTTNITNLAPQTFYRDADGDGYGSPTVTIYYSNRPAGYVTNSSDCNDGDGSLNPTTVWYRDADGDGYGTSATTTASCTQPSGYVRNSSDYNDGSTNITNIAPATFYRDADNDGYGSPTVTVYYSVLPSGYVTNSSDCNDGDATLNPNTPWFRDNDGDGYGSGGAPVLSCTQPTGYVRNSSDYNDTTVNITNIAPSTFYRDADGDSFGNPTVTVYYSVRPTGYVTNNTDCNDSDLSLNPNTLWYRDADGDGYGTSATSTASCTQPTGYVLNSSDYNDTTVNITNIAPQTFYRDADNDTFGSSTVTVFYSVKPTGYVTNSTDCNDSDASLNPNTLWYRDADGDGYGSSAISTASCTQPTGYVRNSNDYEDTTLNITNIAPSTFYRDTDNDTYGSATISVYYSVKPSGYVTNNTDCNDSDASLNPTTVWYRDADGDGYGISAINTASCTQPTGYVRNSNDYDDTTVNITNIAPSTFYRDVDGDTFGSPTVTVYYSAKPSGYVTNNSDYDDSTVNITNIAPQNFYADSDGDGFGNATASIYYSVMPSGYLTNSLDCDDTKNYINPNTQWYADVDGDGLGDAANFVAQCSAPAGYVLDATDNCPLVPGTSSDCGGLANPAQDKNYIITRAYKVASANSIASPTPAQANVGITYFDGLGRPIQQIANQQSNSGKDIVTPIEYDIFGRQPKEYLPFVGSSRNMGYDSNALEGNLNYYTSTYSTSIGFSEKLLEKSPLNRLLEQAAPGDDWRLSNPEKHTIQLDYQTNIADEVKLFDVSLTADYVPSITANGSYDANVLYKTVTTDENNNPNEEFKDKEGRVVLKRNYDSSVAHDTYYVYDVYGNLTYVLPPKAEGDTGSNVLDELCYQYQYDYRNRLVAKKLPGKQWEFMVYDKLDRVVATGPAFSPFSDLKGAGWLITKYDVFNRVVYTAWLNSPATSTARTTMQQAQNNATTINESKQSGTTIDAIAVNYSNNVAPTSFKLLSVNYYDDYAIPNVSGLATSVVNQTVTTATKGLATGSWMRVPTTTAEIKAEASYTLYDYKYRPIRNYTTNYLGGYTYTDSKLDVFSGQLQYTIQKHKRTTGDSELVVKEAFTYSPQDRLIQHTHQINGGAEQLIAENTYDELGQLISKKVGNSSAVPLQKVDYSYNIRGWLTKINEIGSLQQGTDPADLFGFKINYNTVDGNTTVANKLYNGNIAETFWSTATDGGFVRNYGYKYDQLNRLKDATYQKSGQVTGMYDENLSYDKNGNIMNLSRYGDRDEQYLPIQIDNLQYGYATNSNKLMSVVDNSNNTSGFKDGITTGDDYVYDANGNMTMDKNKNITSIVYNHLNLPTKIIFPTGNIMYFYNASGQKVQKVVTENATVTTTDYLGGYQYQNTVLQFFPTAEGYVKNTPVSGTNTYSYVFNYTDHLGNVRLSYTKNPSTNALDIIEENNYYPFGLKHNGYNPITPTPDYKYKYNAKELQEELGLNVTAMDYRQYDSAIGRFLGIDLLSELTPSETPNHFGHNNPVFFSDPSGLWSYQAFGNADTSINMNNTQWLASQRPHDSPVAQLDAMNVNNKNPVSSNPYGGWYKKKIGQRASWEKDNGDFQLETISLENIYTNVFVANGGGGKKYDWGYEGNILGAGGTTYAILENAVANKYWWMDAKGSFNLTKILKEGTNGKFVRGVQGYRNGYNSALKAASGYKVAGSIVGGLGLGITYLQYRNNQITSTEASFDAAFGVIGFLGPIGAGISGTYFIGKVGYEYFSDNTVFEKPR
jgi:hypothetical protein